MLADLLGTFTGREGTKILSRLVIAIGLCLLCDTDFMIEVGVELY